MMTIAIRQHAQTLASFVVPSRVTGMTDAERETGEKIAALLPTVERGYYDLILYTGLRKEQDAETLVK